MVYPPRIDDPATTVLP